MRFTFISSHPAPYRDSFLGGLVKEQAFETDVYSLFPQDGGHDFWKLEAPPYENKVIVSPGGMSWLRVFWRLVRRIVFGGYDCVCWPGFSPSYLVGCMFLQALFRKKYVITADTVEQRKIGGLSFLIKSFLIRRAALLFVPGKKSCEFFVNSFGVDRSKICLGAYSLDGKLLEKQIVQLRLHKTLLRAEYGIGENDKVFLMVANMITTRHYPLTSAAFLKATHGRDDIKFIMVGRGPDLPLMQELAAKEPSIVVFPGVSFREMLKLYALSDVYVHGGTEPASTALVIGAIAHLPLISSPAVGCFADVVRDGETGYAVDDFLSNAQWENAFRRALAGQDDWERMGTRARVLSEELDSDRIVEVFSEKISSVLEGRNHVE